MENYYYLRENTVHVLSAHTVSDHAVCAASADAKNLCYFLVDYRGNTH